MRKSLITSAILAATALAGPALANPYSGIYMFGDSLFDNGQFNGTRFTNRVGPNYNTSDFGPVSPNFVADKLGIPEAAASRDGGTNYAVGANRSIDTLLSITAPTTYEASAGIGNPAVDATFNSLFYNLKQAGQNLDRNAIYIMDGGGNDIGNGLVFDDASAGVVATNMVDAANALKQRGAKYVAIYNVPDFGLSPRGLPFSAFASEMAGKVNTQIQEQVGSANILIIDSFSALQEMIADPAAFGFNLSSAEISRACFDNLSACPEGNADAKRNGSNPDPDQFLFNDELHPTTIGQQITADYINATLQAPGEIGLLPQMGLDDMQNQWRTAQPVMRANRYSDMTPVGDYTVWGGASASENKHETVYNNTGTNEATQYNLGIVYRFNEVWYLGGQLGRSENEMDFGASKSRYEMDSLNLSLLTGYRVNKWFLEGVVSYGDLDYDQLRRRFNLGPVLQRTESGDTSGDNLGVKVTGGLNLIDATKRYRVGPIIGYEYTRSEMDGYDEKAGDATALRVDDMTSSAGVFSGGLFGDMQVGFCECEIYSEVVYRAYTDTSSDDPRIGLLSVPGNSAVLPGYEQDDDSVLWNLGIAARLGPNVQLDLSGGGSDADNGEAYWYGAELTYTF
jgi:outer membrane lipase/esterase